MGTRKESHVIKAAAVEDHPEERVVRKACHRAEWAEAWVAQALLQEWQVRRRGRGCSEVGER